ncbi:MAG: aldehyde dehydrogenase, partial [Betaproteobacteria bacterium]|nr:aldehyde dehydrogenase [Betaproteobacteria bacterium]
MPPRNAYYPGAEERYRTLTRGRSIESFGEAGRGQLPWTLITGLDPRKDEPQFATEPFCGVLSVVEFDTGDPAAFLTEAAAFANDRLWGTLNACIVLH